MNRWKRLNNWLLVGGVTLLMSIILGLYKGYQSHVVGLTQEKSISDPTDPTAQTVSSNTIQDVEDSGVARALQIQTAQPTSEDVQTGLSNGSQKGQEMNEDYNKPQTIKDFPSPVQGKIMRGIGNYYSDNFQNYLFHAGIDYAEPEGTVIRATHGGKVISIGLDPILGQKVTLDCGDGWQVTYGGLDNLRVQDGETVVTQGVVGQVGFFPGAEGQYNQPQLHFEVWHNNEVQKPS